MRDDLDSRLNVYITLAPLLETIDTAMAGVGCVPMKDLVRLVGADRPMSERTKAAVPRTNYDGLNVGAIHPHERRGDGPWRQE